MKSYVIQKGDLSAYLGRLKDKLELWVPVVEDGIAQFCAYEEGKELDFSVHTRISAKSFLMPQRELMFRYSTDSKDQLPEQTLSAGKKLVFGVKPCDARAMMLNARVLVSGQDGSAQDVYFKARQQNTIMVGQGCNQPGAACFCQSSGGDPFGEDGLDALITDIGSHLLLTIISDRPLSELLVEKDYMAEASDQDLATARLVAEDGRKTLVSAPQLVKPDADSKALFDLSLWEETAQRCLNCGICTYLCPTCTCFDIVDEVSEGCGNHLRCWDSCMFSLFTQHASGHNPRPGKKERLRQRFMHKLSYFPDRHNGDVSCVGCGRCILYCPVNIDIREISRQMA
jgi:ferredoxin